MKRIARAPSVGILECPECGLPSISERATYPTGARGELDAERPPMVLASRSCPREHEWVIDLVIDKDGNLRHA